MSASSKTQTNRSSAAQEKRARGIAAMGLVKRDGEKFRVSSPVMDGREDRFEVWRDQQGNVRCTCLEGAANPTDGSFRCEHILAVKHSLVLNNALTGPVAEIDSTAEKVHAEAQSLISASKVAGQPSNTELIADWKAVASVLDQIAPRWSSSIRPIQQIGDQFVVVSSITIDGITRDGIGTADASSVDGIRRAEQRAMQDASTRFAFIQANKRRDLAIVEPSNLHAGATHVHVDPVATSIGDLVMPKQLGMIRALARGAGIDADDESIKLFQCKSDSLTRRAAAEFIDHLKSMQQERNVGMRRAS